MGALESRIHPKLAAVITAAQRFVPLPVVSFTRLVPNHAELLGAPKGLEKTASASGGLWGRAPVEAPGRAAGNPRPDRLRCAPPVRSGGLAPARRRLEFLQTCAAEALVHGVQHSAADVVPRVPGLDVLALAVCSSSRDAGTARKEREEDGVSSTGPRQPTRRAVTNVSICAVESQRSHLCFLAGRMPSFLRALDLTRCLPFGAPWPPLLARALLPHAGPVCLGPDLKWPWPPKLPRLRPPPPDPPEDAALWDRKLA